MSVPWVPPRPTYHLRVFAVSLVLVVLCLVGLLFGVHMEAVAPVTGTITARDVQEVRSLLPGLIEPGWYEGEISLPGNTFLSVRMDSQGNGRVDPVVGAVETVIHHEWLDNGRKRAVKPGGFHRLQPGDELWPGQVVAALRADDLRFQVQRIEDQLKERESRGDSLGALVRERDRLRTQLSQAILTAPEKENSLVLEVRVAPLQAVQPGDSIATLVPIDPQTHQPRDLVARLDVDEKHWDLLKPGQSVRVRSNVHNHRLNGCAAARIERMEPAGEAYGGGDRRFHALAPITASPFHLPIGSSFQAEVIVGRKLVYRIILEH
ncbi:MAG: HlyD family secretion protein [Gemmataceae bacterium]|nr:HlyD family secretion protein [Gemmataceae bacterium]